MNSRIRRRLDMADRVLVFNQTHPSADTGLAPMFDGLAERVTRATALIKAQEEARNRALAGSGRRAQLRRRLASGLLRLIARVGQAAAEEDPSVAPLFQPIPAKSPGRAFIAAAEALIAAAGEHLEILARYGLTQTLLDEAIALLGLYTEATSEAYTARQARIESGGALAGVTAEITSLVGRIDGLNRHRFADDPEILAVWRNARNVVDRGRSPNGGLPAPTAGQQPGTGAEVTSKAPSADAGGEGDIRAAA